MEKHPENVQTQSSRRLIENQFLRFCAVGASGYAVNLAVYAALLAAGMHYLAAAAIAFLVAAASNYAWNRLWTFQTSDAPVLGQGARALTVSALSLGANQLFLLAFVSAGADHLAAQAVAIVLATPFSFAANKLWAFAEGPTTSELQPAAATAGPSSTGGHAINGTLVPASDGGSPVKLCRDDNGKLDCNL